MKPSKVAILTASVALVTGLAGFGIGRATTGHTTVAATAPFSNGAGGGQAGFGGSTRRAGGRPIFGTVASLTSSALVITDTAGTAHTVTISSNTTYTAGDGSTAATQADLTAGKSVAAFGRPAADGTITATRVIINPAAPGAGAPAGSAQAN